MWPFKSKEERLAEMDARVAALVEQRERERDAKCAEAEYLRIKQLEEEKARENELRKIAEQMFIEEREAKKNSEYPWVIVESTDIDESGNIKIRVDWNSAFVKYLKESCNFSGSDEMVIVQKWLGGLGRAMSEDGSNDALNLLTTAGYEREE